MALQDMITSFKGLATIGVILSLLILVFFLAFGRLAMDEQFAGGGETLESRISKNENSLERLRMKKAEYGDQMALFGEREEDAEALAELQISIQKLKEDHASMRMDKEELLDDIQTVEESYYSYRVRYRNYVRQQAVGNEFEKFVTQDGKTYEKVKIKSIDGLGMTITHRDGSKRISFENLPHELQVKYQYDKQEAVDQQRREADMNEQRRLAQVAASREAEIKNAALQQQRAQKEETERRASIKNMTLAIENLDGQIMALQEKIRRESYKSVSRAPILQEDLDKLMKTRQNYAARLRNLTAPQR